MTIRILTKRSAIQDRRPIPTDLEPGELVVSTHTASPGLFLRDSANELVKVGPTYISATAPVPTNHAALSKGETWWDGDNFRIWSGTQWDITNKLGSDFAIPLSIPEIQISNPSETTLTFSAGSLVVLNTTSRIALKIPSAITKSISTWAAGDGNGSVIGSLTNNTWYHAFCIFNPSTSAVDYVLSTSLTPSLPSGFTLSRRLGSILINSASFVTKFFQNGTSFFWEQPVQDLVGVRVPNTKRNYRVSVPPGRQVKVYGVLNPGVSKLNENLLVSANHPSVTDILISDPSSGFAAQAHSSNLSWINLDANGASNPLWLTNTSAQIALISNDQYRNDIGSTNFVTYGWEDVSLARGL